MSDILPACSVCEKQPSASCPHNYCGWRDFCRGRDDRREIARIMGLSDAEIAAEVTRDGETPESVAAKCRAIFERACAIVDGRASTVPRSQREAFEAAWNKRPWLTEEESDKDRAWRWWQAAVASCAGVALEQRCERGTPWDLACVTIAEKIRGVSLPE